MNGQVQSNKRVLDRDGPAAVIYFGALVFLGMLVGMFGFLAVVTILVVAFVAGGRAYDWTGGILLAMLALLLGWLVRRNIQYRGARRRFRRTAT